MRPKLTSPSPGLVLAWETFLFILILVPAPRQCVNPSSESSWAAVFSSLSLSLCI